MGRPVFANTAGSARVGNTNAFCRPCFYGRQYDGPDLASTADILGIDTATLVRWHTETIYTVFMIGFLPGFAYMGILPPALQAPRLPTPRPKVRAGSVGIAGAQTGIYPCDSPGGWRIIGHCDVALFHPASTPPSHLKAGDRVQFIAL
jgi:KipI family sensor histidine kinase inhibitor